MSWQQLVIGKFRCDQYGVIRGNIGGLGIGSIEVIAEDVFDHTGEPYMRLIADPLGAAYEIGFAYYRETKEHRYFSVRLDSPFFQAPIYAALFYDRNDHGLLNLVWRRNRPPRPKADSKPDSSEQQTSV